MNALIEFPKWKYHAVKEAVMVEDKMEELELGPDWADSPANFEKLPESQKKNKSKNESGAKK